MDLSQNHNLLFLVSQNNENLSVLDLRNGNNENMSVTVYDSNLDCILVDDADATYLNDWIIDPFTNFVNNQAECDDLGIDEIEIIDIKLYPNPVSTHLTVVSKVPANITIIDTNGKIISLGVINEGSNTLDVSSFAKGMYFSKIVSENGIVTQKIIKE